MAICSGVGGSNLELTPSNNATEIEFTVWVLEERLVGFVKFPNAGEDTIT